MNKQELLNAIGKYVAGLFDADRQMVAINNANFLKVALSDYIEIYGDDEDLKNKFGGKEYLEHKYNQFLFT
jgi:hypothetical protein